LGENVGFEAALACGNVSNFEFIWETVPRTWTSNSERLISINWPIHVLCYTLIIQSVLLL